MRLSFSSIDTYETCGLKWHYQYRERLPSLPSGILSFGNSLHVALERFYKTDTDVAPSLPELLAHLDDGWISEGYRDADEEAQRRREAEEVLTRYHADNAAAFRRPAAIEQYFQIEVEGVTISGQIDRLDHHDDGSWEVIDYKTNRKLPPRSKLDENLQLSIYHLAAQSLWDLDPGRLKLTLYFLLLGHPFSTARSEQDLDRARRRIANVASRIDAGLFEARPGPLCGWCGFRTICPAVRDRYSAQPGPSDPEIAGMLEEWLTLQREETERAVRRNELEAALITFALEHGYQRLWAQDGTGVEPYLERVGRPPDIRPLREELERLELWERVQAVDEGALAEALRSGRLSPEAEAILKQVEASGDRRWTLRAIREPRNAPPTDV